MQLKYRNPKKGIKYISIMLFVFVLVLVPIYMTQQSALKKGVSEQIKTDMNAYSVNIDNEIAYVGSNVLLMDDIITNRDILVRNGDSLQFNSDSDRNELENDLLDWIKNHKIYDQIRIIGLDGKEVLRINNNELVQVVPVDELQDKSGRYYFENAIVLDDNYLYLSKIDLNIENGEIEYVDDVPKEMLRIATTLFNENNEKIGLLIVNYYVDNLFHDLETFKSEYSYFEVVNEEGYFLHNQDTSLEYGFMYEDKMDYTVDETLGFDFNFKDNQGQIIQENIRNSQYTYVVVNSIKMENAITDLVEREINVFSDNGDIIVLGYVNLNQTEPIVKQINLFVSISIIFFVLLIIVSRLIDEITFSNAKQMDILEYSSNHDVLTGLVNRTGVFKRLESCRAKQEKCTIMYLDLDKFKSINDTYGHSIGDKVLIEFSRRVKECLRETDMIARLGGDEFLVFLKDVDKMENALMISKKIKKVVTKKFEFDDIICHLGVSIGINIQSGDISIDNLIHVADEKMYKDKNSKK